MGDDYQTPDPRLEVSGLEVSGLHSAVSHERVVWALRALILQVGSKINIPTQRSGLGDTIWHSQMELVEINSPVRPINGHNAYS